MVKMKINEQEADSTMDYKEQRLVVIIMGPGKQHFLEMCFDSVTDADKILYFTSDQPFTLSSGLEHLPSNQEVYYNHWDDNDKATNGKCRNEYLNMLKEKYSNDWCLVLDEDELVEDLSKIKEFIQEATPGIYNVKMRHFIGDIGHEDANMPVHVVPGRLFKISEAKGYPLHSHPVLEGELIGACLDTTIWHLGHLPIDYMDYILKRYKQHANDSTIHNQDFLKVWKLAHLFGQYGNKEINPIELPQQILDRYELDKDEFYFANRGLELKHFIDAIHWKEFFKLKAPYHHVLEVGCGKGPRIFAMKQIELNPMGFDISKYAINNSLSPDDVEIGNLITLENIEEYKRFDLVVGYDILEHIPYKDIDKAINNIIKFSNKNILISVPTLGNPNLEADPTHIIEEDKQWWIEKFTDKGLKLIPTPEHFLFKQQIMIFEK